MKLGRLTLLAGVAALATIGAAEGVTLVDFNEVYTLNTVVLGYGSPPITLPTTTSNTPQHPQTPTENCLTPPTAIRATGPFNPGAQATFSSFVGTLDATTSSIDCDSNFTVDPDIVLLSNINPGRVLTPAQQTVWTSNTMALEFQFNMSVTYKNRGYGGATLEFIHTSCTDRESCPVNKQFYLGPQLFDRDGFLPTDGIFGPYIYVDGSFTQGTGKPIVGGWQGDGVNPWMNFGSPATCAYGDLQNNTTCSGTKSVIVTRENFQVILNQLVSTGLLVVPGGTTTPGDWKLAYYGFNFEMPAHGWDGYYNHYIDVSVNNVQLTTITGTTGATPSVTVYVNGIANGDVTIAPLTPFTLSWTSTNAVGCDLKGEQNGGPWFNYGERGQHYDFGTLTGWGGSNWYKWTVTCRGSTGLTNQASGVVRITTPPTVSLTNPANNAKFNAPASVALQASASDADGITKVEYFRGTAGSYVSLGSSSTAPYAVTWSGAPAGIYQITAVATDGKGATTRSSSRKIYVSGTPPSLSNSGFEAPSIGSGAWALSPATNGWTFDSLSGVSGNNSAFTSGNPAAPAGVQVGILHGVGSVKQSVSFPPGYFKIQVKAAKRGNFTLCAPSGPNPCPPAIDVTVCGTAVGQLLPSSTSYQTLTSNAFEKSSTGSCEIKLQGISQNGADIASFVDDVKVIVAP